MPYLSTTSPKVRDNANAHPFATSRKDSARSSRIILPANFSHQLSRPSWATPSSISVILFPRPRSHSTFHTCPSPFATLGHDPQCSWWSEVIKCPNCLIRAVYGSHSFPFFSSPAHLPQTIGGEECWTCSGWKFESLPAARSTRINWRSPPERASPLVRFLQHFYFASHCLPECSDRRVTIISFPGVSHMSFDTFPRLPLDRLNAREEDFKRRGDEKKILSDTFIRLRRYWMKVRKM